MKTARFAIFLLVPALAFFPACGEKKEEDKKITIQFNVSKEKEEKTQEAAKPPIKPAPAPSPAKKDAPPDKPAVVPAPPERPLKPQIARKESSPEVEEKLAQARSALERKDPREAILSLNEVKRLDPDNPRLYPMLARAHQMNRDREAARAAIQEGLSRNPDDAVLLYLRGFLRHREGNAQLARQDLRRALEIDPNLPMAQRARQTLQDIEEGKPARRPAARRLGPGGGPPGVDDF